jgi:hypothetical protein
MWPFIPGQYKFKGETAIKKTEDQFVTLPPCSAIGILAHARIVSIGERPCPRRSRETPRKEVDYEFEVKIHCVVYVPSGVRMKDLVATVRSLMAPTSSEFRHGASVYANIAWR